MASHSAQGSSAAEPLPPHPHPQAVESLKSSSEFLPLRIKMPEGWEGEEARGPFPLSYSLPSPLVGGALNSARLATLERSNPLARHQVKGILGLLRSIVTTERSIKGV